MSYSRSWSYFLTGIVFLLASQSLPAQAPSTSVGGGGTPTTGGGNPGGGGGGGGNIGGTAISGTSFNNLGPSPTSAMSPSMAIGGNTSTSFTGRTGTGTTTNTPVPTSYNPWTPYYLNAYQPGLGSSLTGTQGQGRNTNTSSGAFGQPLYSLVTTTTTGTPTSTASTQSQGNGFTTLGMSKAPAYVAALSPDFPTTRISSNQLQKELLATLQRSSALRGQGQIDLTVTKNGQVILKGQVSRNQLRLLAEGLVRMTPGVGDVQNDLQVTAAKK